MAIHPLTLRHHRVWALAEPRQLDVLVVTNLANIRYLTGFAGTAGLLAVTPARLYLLVDFRYSAAVAALVRSGAAAPDLEIVNLEASSGYDRRLADLVASEPWRLVGFEAGHVSVARWRGWNSLLGTSAEPGGTGGRELVETDQIVEKARVTKDAGELTILREAARRLSQVARAVLDEAVRPGRTEQEIAADIDGRLVRAGFEKPAFDTIVASGTNSALPHARPTARRVADGDLVVLDFGGVHEGYCVDLTRTVAVGQVGAEQRRIYEAVKAAHAAAVEAAGRPGVDAGAVDAAARDTLGVHGLAEKFGHGTGHGLGLDVHELPRLSRRTAENPGTDVLESGMVFTIEPGAYVEGVGGVRIEDDLVRTADGVDVLTDVPREWRVIV
jgi:Xaa-Pro aminopeptidase